LGKIRKFFDADPGWKNSDPGWKNVGSGIRDGKNSDSGSGMEKSTIRDKHPGSATLISGKDFVEISVVLLILVR
jgi:hypothetical protein